MPLQATSGAASYDGFGGGVAAVPNYIEECFSAFLYTGNGSTQTITNGIDLAGKGGMTWFKRRDGAADHQVYDTVRGGSSAIFPNLTIAAQAYAQIDSFNANGLTINNSGAINSSGSTFASWTFRKQPKFFDVVTYTGTGSSRTVAHNLGSTPGAIFIKKTSSSSTDGWPVYHRSSSNLCLNKTTQAGTTYSGVITSPTATNFTVSSNADANANGQTYVAYLFAHNAGGFGLTGTDNVISCGSYTGNGSTTGPEVTLGYEPQWLLIRQSSSTGNWWLTDNMRGFNVTSDQFLLPNSSGAEITKTNYVKPLATGFQIVNSDFDVNESGSTYIYIAIRRGPMKVPTSGTSVFNVQTASSASSGTVLTTNMNTDMIIGKNRNGNYWAWGTNKLTGFKETGVSNNTEWRTSASGTYISAWGNRTVTLGTEGDMTGAGEPVVWYSMTRAPSFMDVVCYKGNGSSSGQVINHNLGVTPELIIIKSRSGGYQWHVYAASLGQSSALFLESTSAAQANSAFTGGTINSTQFQLKVDFANVNGSGVNYVSYLFASCPGVSKVGSYTGNGSSQTINCGFTGGARFVMIKSITQGYSQSKWYVWDTARGLVSGNDPYLMFNESSGEGAGLDAIDPDSSGFIVNQVGDAYNPTDTNASGQTYIYLAIA